MQSTSRSRRNKTIKVTRASKQLPGKPKYQFILRNIRFNPGNNQLLKKINLKGLYVHKIIEEGYYNDEEEAGTETAHQRYIRSKLFKGLRHIKIASLQRPYWQETLKRAKGLRSIKIHPTDNFGDLGPIPKFIKRLPKDVEDVRIDIYKQEAVLCKYIYQIPKKMAYLRNLKIFKRSLLVDGDESYVSKELGWYNKSAGRLKRLEKLEYDQCSSEQKGLHKFMRGNKMNPAITVLKMYLSAAGLENYNRFRQIYGEFVEKDQENVKILRATGSTEGVIMRGRRARSQENSGIFPTRMGFLDLFGDDGDAETQSDDEDEEEEEEEEGQPNNRRVLGRLQIEEMMEKELSPYFRLNLFPNLQKLNLLFEDALYPLGSFVLRGFQELKNLKELKIDIMSRSIRTKYIFQGMLFLPLLKTFTLRITHLKHEDWRLLNRFITNQRELETFGLYVRLEKGTKEQYFQQNQNLESMIKTFEGHKAIKSLDIQSAYWSLEVLSNGLKHLLKMPNQLKTFRFQGSDDTINSTEKYNKRVEGLCKFLKSQSKSLEELYVRFPLALEENVVSHVCEAVGKLTELRKLTFLMNNTFSLGLEYLTHHYEQTLQIEIMQDQRKKLGRSKKWNPKIAKALKGLQKLEELSIDFDLENKEDEESLRWFIDVFKMIPEMKSLRKFTFSSHSCKAVMGVEGKLARSLMEMRNVRAIAGDVFDNVEFDLFEFELLVEALILVNIRQSLRSDLMF